MNSVLQVLEHLIQDDLTALLDHFAELDLQLVFYKRPELSDKRIDYVRELATLQNQVQVWYFQIDFVDVDVNPLVIQEETQVKAEVDVIEDGSAEARVLEQLNITHHVILEEEVETKILNFEVKCWRSVNRCDVSVLNVKLYLVQDHLINGAIYFSPIRNVFHCDVLELCQLSIADHFHERLTRVLSELLHGLFALNTALWWLNGPIIWQQLLHEFLI